VNWATTAVLSSVLYAAVNIIDSHLLSRRMPGLRSFLLPIAVVHSLFALVVFFLFPLPANLGVKPVLAIVIAGVLRIIAAVIMLHNLRREEVSLVIPVVYSYPIFVAIIAMPLLGEVLSALQWVAVVIVVVGTLLVSAKKMPTGLNGWLAKFFPLLLFAGLLFAVADVATKYALNYMSFWSAFSLNTFTMSGITLLFAARPEVVKQLIAIKPRKTFVWLIVVDEALTLVAVVLWYWAMTLGPVSLVSTILGSRPAFVALFALLLSQTLPQFLLNSRSKGLLALRLFATAMIVGGIAIIYLT